jgi:hypothetical protein
MTEPVLHKIRRTAVNMHYNGNAEGMALSREVSDWCKSRLIPEIGAVLSEYDLAEEVIYIDRISLDINLVSSDNWQNELADMFGRQLKEIIHSKIQQGGTEAKVKPPSLSFGEALLYFLKFGILPWNSDLGTRDDFKVELATWIRSASAAEMKKLLTNLDESNSKGRLTDMPDQKDFEIMIAALTEETPDAVASHFKDAAFIISVFTGEKQLLDRFLKDYKAILLAECGPDSQAGHLRRAFTRWMNDIGLNYADEVLTIDAKSLITNEIKNILLNIQQNICCKKAGKKIAVKDLKEKIPAVQEKTPEESKAGLVKELREGVFIGNAGVVIVAPFLPALFTRTGLNNDGQVTDGSTALSLVHYCVKGNPYPAEFELLLPKLLCGIAPETLVDPMPLTDENMMKEADEMLASVIEHWSVLKDTSIGGLREAFLQRPGKLVFSEDEWLLFVEQKPYDMLLEQLPWNIGMIKLPWMKYILRTHWF